MSVHILIIDDEAAVGDVLRRALESKGYTVDVARDGQSGLRKLSETDFALILCDVVLPGLSGPGFYEAVRRSHSHMLERIAFITGETVDSQIESMLGDTKRPCLRKPFGLEQLYALVTQIVDRV